MPRTRTALAPSPRIPRSAAVVRPRPSARRTQEERSATTRAAILTGALDSLRRRGYSQLTLADIQKSAKVSRGALLHHFRAKHELVACAMAQFYADRLARTQVRLATLPREAALRDRLAVMWQEAADFFPVTIDFNLAMRTDAKLAKAFDKAMESLQAPMKGEYARLLPEFSDQPDGLWMMYLIGCFHRGLCLEALVNDQPTVLRIREQFATVLEAFVRSRR